MDTKTEAAWADISRGFGRLELPVALGWHDLSTRYRRTKLGPLWHVLGTGILVAGVGTVWSTIFNMDLGDLFPYLAAGFIIWQLYSGAVVEGPTLFINQVHIIRSINLPLSFHVLRALMRNIFNFMHNMIIFVLVALIFGVTPTWEALWLIPAALLVLCNMFWISMLLGLIGARFHDVSPLIGSVMALVFLLTPVMWKPEMLMGRSRLIVDLNPFAHFIELLRAPLLGMAPRLLAWEVSILVTVVGLILTFLAMRAWCRQLPFWM